MKRKIHISNYIIFENYYVCVSVRLNPYIYVCVYVSIDLIPCVYVYISIALYALKVNNTLWVLQ